MTLPKGSKYVGTCVGLGIILGASFGITYARMTEEDVGFWIAIGVGFGLTIGAAIGTRLDAKAKKKNMN